MSSFLEQILSGRRRAVEALQPALAALEERARNVPTSRDFTGALRRDGISIITEIKRRSPSKGELKSDLDPAELARAYERGGAHAISVLTEPDFFDGSGADLTSAREATRLPVLWKDFILDRAQIVDACVRGADAILLIVRILGEDLGDLVAESRRWGLTALVEVFDEQDVERALDGGADVIGVNHRDLETFDEDPTATARLRPLIPDEVVVVGESGISERSDVQALEAIGVDAILVGEALVRSADPAAKIQELLGR
ncbi:MAG: indole-3-glycerol phosphate synthase TrpC [Actinomycetota bacterium]